MTFWVTSHWSPILFLITFKLMSTISISAPKNRNLSETFKFLVIALHTPSADRFIRKIVNASITPRQIAHALSYRTGELSDLLPEPLLIRIQWQSIDWRVVGEMLAKKPNTTTY